MYFRRLQFWGWDLIWRAAVAVVGEVTDAEAIVLMRVKMIAPGPVLNQARLRVRDVPQYVREVATLHVAAVLPGVKLAVKMIAAPVAIPVVLLAVKPVAKMIAAPVVVPVVLLVVEPAVKMIAARFVSPVVLPAVKLAVILLVELLVKVNALKLVQELVQVVAANTTAHLLVQLHAATYVNIVVNPGRCT